MCDCSESSEECSCSSEGSSCSSEDSSCSDCETPRFRRRDERCCFRYDLPPRDFCKCFEEPRRCETRPYHNFYGCQSYKPRGDCSLPAAKKNYKLPPLESRSPFVERTADLAKPALHQEGGSAEIAVSTMSMNETTVPFEVVAVGGAEVWCWKIRRLQPLTTLVSLPTKCRVVFYFVSDFPSALELRFQMTLGRFASAKPDAKLEKNSSPERYEGTVTLADERLYEVSFSRTAGRNRMLAICELRRVDDFPDECGIVHGRILEWPAE